MIQRNRARRVSRVVALICATTLVAAACGGDDDDESDASDTAAPSADTAAPAADTTAPSADTAAPSADTTAPAADTTAPAADTTAPSADTTAAPAVADKSPLLIVGTFDIGGPSPVPPAGADAVQAWADHINAQGGINGHPVEVDIRDTKGDAAAAQTLTQELLAMDPILFLLNTPSTEASQAELLGGSQVPVMGVGYNPAIWGGHIAAFNLTCSNDEGSPLPCGLANAFAVTTTPGAVIDEQLYGAQAAGATKVTSAVCAEVDSCSTSIPVFAATAAALGLEVVESVKVSSTASDYSAECIGFMQEGVDFIQLSGGLGLSLGVINSCKDQGYEGIFGASAGSVHGELIEFDDITLAGGLHAFPWWADDPLVQEYRDAMAAGGVDEEGIADPTTTGIWSVLQLFAKAQANLSDAPTGAEAIENMYTIQDETLGGLIAPVSYSPDDPDRSRDCFWPYVLEGGEMSSPLGGLAYQCSPPEE
jgi:branched-chain amino acid transport system substrate-binding protein